jgi:hypothetical protein
LVVYRGARPVFQRIRAYQSKAAAMVEESERMTAMRQANPFAGILTPRERWAIYDQFPSGTT